MRVALKVYSETTSNLHTFWIKVQMEYPEIAKKAMKSLLPFSTSYLWEVGFSAVTVTKMRWLSRRDISSTLQASVSPITSRQGCLVAGKHAQDSHWFCNVVSCIIIFSTSQCNNDRNKVHNKCNMLESSRNHPPAPAPVCAKIVFHEALLVSKRSEITVVCH